MDADVPTVISWIQIGPHVPIARQNKEPGDALGEQRSLPPLEVDRQVWASTPEC